MEVEKTVTQLPVQQAQPKPGVIINPQTGEAAVPTPEGNVRVEVKADGTPHFLFQNTPAAHKLADEFIRLNSLQEEAAAAKGQTYNPKLGERLKNLATSNLTPFKTVAFVVIGYTAYRIGAWAARRLAEYMGWDLFGNEMLPEDGEMHAGGNKDFDERRSPRRQPRRQQEPTQPTASA